MVSIPITHDETATTVHYYNFGFWEIMMYPDAWPNNHILNTLITKIFINVFGKLQWVVRLPNLLFFIIYSIGVYRLLKNIVGAKSTLFFASLAFFFANAYLLDFFSLCRGYGMSTALVTLSLSFLLTGYLRKGKTHIWIAFFCAILASYANFTALVFWASTTFFCLLYFLLVEDKSQRIKLIIQMIIASFGYLALIYVPIKKMTSTDQFEYWTSNGFYQDTIFSLVEHWRYNMTLPFDINAKTISLSIVVLTGLSLIYVFRKMFLSNSRFETLSVPIVLLCSVLLFTALISIFQSWLLGTPNLSGRTALFFYPLLAAFLTSVFSKVTSYVGRNVELGLSIVIPLLFLFHFVQAYNSKSVREWWYDESTFEVLDTIREMHPNVQNISLEVNWHFHRSFFFYKDTDQTPWLTLMPHNKEIDKDSKAQYYYVMEPDLKQLEGKFDPIEKLGWDRWLLKRAEDIEQDDGL